MLRAIFLLASLPWLSCARTGFDVAEEPPASGVAGSALANATADAVSLDANGATLVRTEGFELSPTTLPTAQSSRAACTAGTTFFVGGGSPAYPSYANCTTEFLAYEPATQSLTVAGALAEPIQGFKLVAHSDGTIYKIMGDCGNSSEEPRVYRFNEATSLFDHVGNFPSGAMYFAGGVLVDTVGEEQFVRAGGYGTGPLYDVVQTFDPTIGSGTELGITLPSGRCLLGGGAVVGSALYVFGGNTNGSGCALPSTRTFNPLLDEILKVKIAPVEEVVTGTVGLPEPLAGTCAVSRADDTIVLFGGVTYQEGPVGTFTRTTSTTVYVFDPATGAVTTHPEPLPAPRAGLACAENADGRVLLFGGADDTLAPTDEIWLFEPHAALGQLTSESLDGGEADARWHDLELDADTPNGTAVTLFVRADDDPTALTTAAWQQASESPLPRGRYFQWRADLETTNGYVTPTVRSVTVAFGPD